MAYSTLVQLYLAAVNRVVNDNYDAKIDRFNTEVSRLWMGLKTVGIPIVVTPLPCPGAVHEVGVGIWDVNNVLKVAGAASGGPFEIVATWTGASYTSATIKGNQESYSSARIAVVPIASEVIRVDITSLVPITSSLQNLGVADGAYNLVTPTGWNVYAGTPGGRMFLQNSTPIPIATKTYTFAADPVLSGTVLDDGQTPDSNFVIGNFNVVNRA
jgi:hypothetical protein